MKLSTVFVCCFCVTAVDVVSAQFDIFGSKRDCSMSLWSDWSPPLGFGTISRERAIMAHPVRGGKPCPTDLVQTNSTNIKPTIQDTATAVKTSFIRRQGRVMSGKSQGVKRDLLVILDSSGSIGSSNFDLVKTQLARLLGLLCPVPDPFRPNYQRAALIEYSSVAKQMFDFDDKRSTHEVQTAIKGLPYMGRSTCTATAFRLAHGMFTPAKGMRTDPDVVQEVLILSDGQSNCGGDAVKEVKRLQKKAAVFGLMIGSFSPSGKQELLSYVSGPINKHLFAIQNFQDLKLLVDEVEAQVSHPGTPPCAPFDI